MGTIQSLLTVLTRSRITRFFSYALAFWGLDVIASRLIPWQRTGGGRIIVSLLVAALFMILEGRQGATNNVASDRQRSIGVMIVVALVIVAVAVTLLDPR
jgi:hypothetical protein